MNIVTRRVCQREAGSRSEIGDGRSGQGSGRLASMRVKDVRGCASDWGQAGGGGGVLAKAWNWCRHGVKPIVSYRMGLVRRNGTRAREACVSDSSVRSYMFGTNCNCYPHKLGMRRNYFTLGEGAGSTERGVRRKGRGQGK